MSAPEEKVRARVEELRATLQRGGPIDDAAVMAADALAGALKRAAYLRAADDAVSIRAALVDFESAHRSLDDDERAVFLEQLEAIEADLPAIAPAPVPVPAPRDLADPTMLELFRMEAETHAATLVAGLLAAERAGSLDPERVTSLMRAAHSLKGAARVVGLDVAVSLAHVLEECFLAARAGTLALAPDVVDRLLPCADLFAELGAVPAADSAAWLAARASAFGARVTDLEALLAGRAAAAEPIARAAPTPSGPAPAPEKDASVLRIGAADVNRMLALAGAARDQIAQIGAMAEGVARLQKKHVELVASLDQMQHDAVAARVDGAFVEGLKDARARSRDGATELGYHLAALRTFQRRFEDVGERLYRQSIASRMRPFGDGVRALPRLARDLARSLGKSVELELGGLSVGVDRDLLDRLEAPLGHMLRNAIDHGIETPEERRAARKRETATIRVEARHHAGMLSVRFTDDGRGLDAARVRDRIVERGLLDRAAADALSDAAALDFLFRPGFSTRTEVTEVSGRGVGLDVVRGMVRAVGGSLRMSSEPGRGTTFHLQMPVTLSVMRAVIVSIAGDPYAVPLLRVRRILSLPAEDVQSIEKRRFFALGDERVGLVSAAQVLELPADSAPRDPKCVVVVGDRAESCGLEVDRFLGEQDIVVRPLDPRLGKVLDVSAVAVTSDGDPMLILDVEDILSSVLRMVEGGGLVEPTPSGPTLRRRVLCVDDSLLVREVQRQILTHAGYDVTTAVDGVDAWEIFQRGQFDLVITDLDMPRSDGISLVRAIKQDPKRAETKVMVVSYRDREQDLRGSADAGADAFLTKGNFHDNTLVDEVARLLAATSRGRGP